MSRAQFVEVQVAKDVLHSDQVTVDLHLDMSRAQFAEVQGAKDALCPDLGNVIHLRSVVETIF